MQTASVQKRCCPPPSPAPARAVPRPLQQRSRTGAAHQPGGGARVPAAAGAAVAHRRGARDREYDPHARGQSSVGAQGLMQVMPMHAGAELCQSSDLVDVDSNICHGTLILRATSGAPAPRPRRCCVTTAASAAPTRPTAGAIPRACWRAPASCAESCWPAPRRWPWQRDSGPGTGDPRCCPQGGGSYIDKMRAKKPPPPPRPTHIERRRRPSATSRNGAPGCRSGSSSPPTPSGSP